MSVSEIRSKFEKGSAMNSSSSSTPSSPTKLQRKGSSSANSSFVSNNKLPSPSEDDSFSKSFMDSVEFETSRESVITKPVLPKDTLKEMEKVMGSKRNTNNNNNKLNNNNTSDGGSSVLPSMKRSMSQEAKIATMLGETANTSNNNIQQQQQPKNKPNLVIETSTPPPPQQQQQQVRASAMTSPLAQAASALVPPTEEEMDELIIFLLSFLVPWFCLRFVFEVVQKLVVKPARLAFRHAPGFTRFLTFVWLKFTPYVATIKASMPSLDNLNAAARRGMDMFLQSIKNSAEKASPHLISLWTSVQNLKFKQAASDIKLVVMAWGPVIKDMLPMLKQLLITSYEGFLIFWQLSGKAVRAPFGGVLKGFVQHIGKSLSDNPERHVERLTSLIGPIIVFQISGFLILVILYQVNLVSEDTLSRLWVAWLFRLFGLLE